MVVKHGLASGYETPLPPRTAVKTPPKTAGSVMWSEFSGRVMRLSFNCFKK